MSFAWWPTANGWFDSGRTETLTPKVTGCAEDRTVSSGFGGLVPPLFAVTAGVVLATANVGVWGKFMCNWSKLHWFGSMAYSLYKWLTGWKMSRKSNKWHRLMLIKSVAKCKNFQGVLFNEHENFYHGINIVGKYERYSFCDILPWLYIWYGKNTALQYGNSAKRVTHRNPGTKMGPRNMFSKLFYQTDYRGVDPSFHLVYHAISPYSKSSTAAVTLYSCFVLVRNCQ